MATVNDVTNQIDKDGQYPEEESLKLNALNELYEQYKQFKGNKTFIEWLDRYARAFDQGAYNGYTKAELMTTARTHANDYPVINGITNGTNTLTQEGRAGDSTSVNERSNRDLPSDENGITSGETAENAQQPTTDTTESSAIGANPEDQADQNIPPTNEQNIEESEASQEPGGSGTMGPPGITSGRELLNAGREEFRRLSDITSNMNNNNQESTSVQERETPSSTTTTTTANKSDTPTPTSTPVQEENTPTPTPTNTPAGQPAEMVNRSGRYEQPEAPAIRPVDRGRFDYIRNNGWGSNSSILTRMGYSPEEIRRILDNSGAVRPEYFSY